MYIIYIYINVFQPFSTPLMCCFNNGLGGLGWIHLRLFLPDGCRWVSISDCPKIPKKWPSKTETTKQCLGQNVEGEMFQQHGAYR